MLGVWLVDRRIEWVGLDKITKSAKTGKLLQGKSSVKRDGVQVVNFKAKHILGVKNARKEGFVFSFR